MSTNEEIARRFDEMAQGFEILGANPFRANAYARAARTLRDLEEDVRTIAADDPPTAAARLAALPGIGESTAAKILDFIEHGSIKEHREMLEKLPATLFDVLGIPGLGPKAVKAMWEQLGIASIADLEAKLDSPELAALHDAVRRGDELRDLLDTSIERYDARPIAVIGQDYVVPKPKELRRAVAAWTAVVFGSCYVALPFLAEVLTEALDDVEEAFVVSKGELRLRLRRDDAARTKELEDEVLGEIGEGR